MSGKRWSPQEDRLLINTIKKDPSNLNKCFIAVASKLNKQPGAVSMHWYSTLRKKQEVFALLVDNKKAINAKNTKVGIQKQWEDKFKRILKIILE